MEKLLRLKAWPLFCLLFLAPVVLTIVLRKTELFPNEAALLAIGLINVLATLLYCGWIYAACIRLCELLPQDFGFTAEPVKIAFILPVIYILWGPLSSLLGLVATGDNWVTWLSIVLALGFLGGILYGIYYMAKLLKSAEYERPVSGGDCVGDFLRIMFFPIGIWNIQPRLNDIASHTPEDMDIFKQDPVY